jgi:hypothetical protein
MNRVGREMDSYQQSISSVDVKMHKRLEWWGNSEEGIMKRRRN